MTLPSQLSIFFNSFIFWAAWIIIPFIMEIVPAIGSMFLLVRRTFRKRKYEHPTLYPEITIIVPVYNSASTLAECIRSISDSTYPNERMRVFLVNNNSTDNSFAVYARCQNKHPDLIMQWLDAEQGKSRALNLALYNSQGKYIVHVDSDGILEPSALMNMISRFEANDDINCMTGAVLVNPELVELYPRGPKRLLRKLEFMEYTQAFLAGRNYASEINFVYTLSGAFTAFRNTSILSSWLYNTETICEDTQITFQMRYNMNEKPTLCENALFLADPIENMDKLYTQRQRWQRGSLEVAKMFSGEKLSLKGAFSDVAVNTLLYDHTFAFPRMIWYLALICLVIVGYSGKTVLLAMGVIFLMYIACGYMYFAVAVVFLKPFSKIRRYYIRQWWVVMLLPFYNLMVFFFRMIGIINSIKTNSAWKMRTLSEEGDSFLNVVRNDFAKVASVERKIKGWVNASPSSGNYCNTNTSDEYIYWQRNS